MRGGDRMEVLCCSVRANLYPCPENSDDRQALTLNVMTRLEDLNVVIGQTRDHRQRLLTVLSKTIRQWQIQLIKIKSIYYTMNLFNHDVARKCFIAECWAPTQQLNQIQSALQRGSVSLSSLLFSLSAGDDLSLAVLAEQEWPRDVPVGVERGSDDGAAPHIVPAE